MHRKLLRLVCLRVGGWDIHPLALAPHWLKIPEGVTSPALPDWTVPVHGLNVATAVSEKALSRRQKDIQIMFEVECGLV